MNYSLLGIAHPVVGPPFQVQRVYRETTLTQGRDFEGSQNVALINIFVNYIRTS